MALVRVKRRNFLPYELMHLAGRVVKKENGRPVICDGVEIAPCYYAELEDNCDYYFATRNGEVKRATLKANDDVIDSQTGEVLDVYLYMPNINPGMQIILCDGSTTTVVKSRASGINDAKDKTHRFANIKSITLCAPDERTCKEVLLTGSNVEKAVAVSNIIMGTDTQNVFSVFNRSDITAGKKYTIHKPEDATWPSWCDEMDKVDGKDCTIEKVGGWSFSIKELPGWAFPINSIVAETIGEKISKMSHDELVNSVVHYTLLNKEQAEIALKRRFK